MVRSQSTFRIIRTAAIKEIEVVALPAAPTPSTGGKWADKRSAEDEEELPKIDIEVVAAREKRAVEKAEEEAKMWHEGVTGRAMLIFEALSKTMPCEWLPMPGNTLGIVVLREVRCLPPPLLHSSHTATIAATAATATALVLRRLQVLIASPYDADSCRASPSHPDTAALPRVQKVLAGELAKLSL